MFLLNGYHRVSHGYHDIWPLVDIASRNDPTTILMVEFGAIDSTVQSFAEFVTHEH